MIFQVFDLFAEQAGKKASKKSLPVKAGLSKFRKLRSNVVSFFELLYHKLSYNKPKKESKFIVLWVVSH